MAILNNSYTRFGTLQASDTF